MEIDMKIRKGIIFFCMIFMTAMMIIGCSEDGNKSVGATTDDTESGETSGQIPEKVDIKGNASIGNDTFFLEFNSYTGGLNKLIDPRDETLLNYVAVPIITGTAIPTATSGSEMLILA